MGGQGRRLFKQKARLKSAVALSTTMSAKRESVIMAAACISSCCWCSVLCARA
jgi:hypothetical protein